MLLSLKNVAIFVGVWILFVIIDLFWLGFIMRDFYMESLAEKARVINGALAPHWPASLAVWLLIVLGIFAFVLPRANSIMTALVLGALYGFILYGVYDLTNFATLSNWPVKLVVADIVWGTFLNAIVSSIAYLIVYAV